MGTRRIEKVKGILVTLIFGAYHLPANEAAKINALYTWYEVLSGSAHAGGAWGLYGVNPHSSFNCFLYSSDYGSCK